MPTFRTNLTLAALLFAVVSLPLLAQSEASIQDGVFSEKQAKQGQKLYADACSACHMEDAFTGARYMSSWSGQTVDDLVTFIQDTMPEDNPSGLARTQYVEIVAFMLKLNGLPTGEADMETSPEDLQQTIEGPFEPSS